MNIIRKRKSCAIVGLTPPSFPYYCPEEDVPEDSQLSPDSDFEDTSYKECQMEKHPDCIKTKERLKNLITTLVLDGVHEFYCAVEQGIGMWAMEIILDMNSEETPLTLTLVSAWEGEADQWNANARYRLFDNILPHPSVKTFRVSNLYTDTCIQQRDKILLQRSDVLIALNDGYNLSDLGLIISKAKKRKKEVLSFTVA